MYTTHGHWFPPAAPGEQPPLPTHVVLCGGPGACPVCATETHLAAVSNGLLTGTMAVLNSPTPGPVPSPPSGSPSFPLDGIRDWVARYLELKDAAKRIEEKLDEAKAVINDAIKSQLPEIPDKLDLTIGGRPVLRRQVVSHNRVDTKRLRAERPDIAKEYTVEGQQERLNIL